MGWGRNKEEKPARSENSKDKIKEREKMEEKNKGRRGKTIGGKLTKPWKKPGETFFPSQIQSCHLLVTTM